MDKRAQCCIHIPGAVDEKKERLGGALFYVRLSYQPRDARAPRRVRVVRVVSVVVLTPAPVPVVPTVVLVLLLVPVPVAVPVAPVPMPEPVVVPAAVPLREPGPALPGLGSAAPICPAAVPGPERPAASVSAGEPVAACALENAIDMQPAINANVSFFMGSPSCE